MTTHGIAIMQRLARNNAWSNLRLHRACARLDPAEFTADRTSFFPSLPKTLNHILVVDWYYVDALLAEGKGLACFANEAPFTDLAELTKAQLDVDAKLVAFTNGLADDAALDAEVRMERAGRTQKDCVSNVLLHLFTHQTHHRGQAHAMLSGTSVSPPQLDEFFMKDELALREQELRDLGLPLR